MAGGVEAGVVVVSARAGHRFAREATSVRVEAASLPAGRSRRVWASSTDGVRTDTGGVTTTTNPEVGQGQRVGQIGHFVCNLSSSNYYE